MVTVGPSAWNSGGTVRVEIFMTLFVVYNVRDARCETELRSLSNGPRGRDTKRRRSLYKTQKMLAVCVSLALGFCAPALKVCPLCQREIPPELESRHHLVPKLKGGKQRQINLMVLHHAADKVHAVFTEAELARSYTSTDALLSHPEISKFAKWIAKRPINSRTMARRGLGGDVSGTQDGGRT